jgi:hypothetical protein
MDSRIAAAVGGTCGGVAQEREHCQPASNFGQSQAPKVDHSGIM